MKAMFSPEQAEFADLTQRIDDARNQLLNLQTQIGQAQIQLGNSNQRLLQLQNEIIETDETVLLQSFGLYTPHYNFALSDDYKEHLKFVRDQQKVLIKTGQAVTGYTNWSINGSLSQGNKMVRDMQKLLLRAFNAECDDVIEHVKFSNKESSEKRINSSAEAISKLGTVMGIYITVPYVQLKIQELYLMHEYQWKKNQEKEAAKEIRARQREEAKVAKELEEAKQKLEKEQTHYKNALTRINSQLTKTSSDVERESLLEKKKEIEDQLLKIDQEMKTVDYRAANQRAGYVYIISNIGAFGENVFKIGMTRRLEPMDRIDELGDASVPFDFDVHAMMFSDDAPKLEAALHNAFADRKINCVNQRREFFAVTLDEIKAVVRQNYDKTVEFVDVAPAEQYRESQKIRAVMK